MYVCIIFRSGELLIGRCMIIPSVATCVYSDVLCPSVYVYVSLLVKGACFLFSCLVFFPSLSPFPIFHFFSLPLSLPLLPLFPSLPLSPPSPSLSPLLLSLHRESERGREKNKPRKKERAKHNSNQSRASDKNSKPGSPPASAHYRILKSWEPDYSLGLNATRAPILFSLEKMHEKLRAVKGQL